MDKINFRNGQAPYVNDVNLNQMQTNIENAINNIDVSDQINALIEHKYTSILTSALTSQEIALPAKYKVGTNCLDVFCNGIKLIKASTSDSEGHYYEVGDNDSISNTIKIATDWYNDEDERPTTDDVFEFVIRR